MTGITASITGKSDVAVDDPFLRRAVGATYEPSSSQVRGAFVEEFLTDDGVTARLSAAGKIQRERGETPYSIREGGYMGGRPAEQLSPALTQDDWKESKYYREGLEYREGMREAEAQILAERHDRRARRDFILEKARTTQKVGGWAAGLASAFADPLNVMTAFVPVPGLTAARIAGISARIGKTPARLAVGAAEGAFGSALIEPFMIGTSPALQDDYGMAESLLNIAVGSVVGSGLHAGIGKVADTRLISTMDSLEALGVAVQQLQAGRRVEVGPVVDDAIDKGLQRLLDSPESLFAEGAWRAAKDFDLGEISGSQYRDYTPLNARDRYFVRAVNDELQMSIEGDRLFIYNEDAPGSTVMGYKSQSPEWFQNWNKEAKEIQKERKRLREKGVPEEKLPEPLSSISKKDVDRVTSKLMTNQPLGKNEARIAQQLTGEARRIRENDVNAMLEMRDQRERLRIEEADAIAEREELFWEKQYDPDTDRLFEDNEFDDIPFEEVGEAEPVTDASASEPNAEIEAMKEQGILDDADIELIRQVDALQQEAGVFARMYDIAAVCLTRS